MHLDGFGMKNMRKERKGGKLKQKCDFWGMLPNAGRGFYSQKNHVIIDKNMFSHTNRYKYFTSYGTIAFILCCCLNYLDFKLLSQIF